MRSQLEVIDRRAIEMDHRTLRSECGIAECGVTADLKVCTTCRLRNYCCKEHQKADWKVHKLYCKAPIPEDDFTVVRSYDYVACAEVHRREKTNRLAKHLVDALRTSNYPSREIAAIFGMQFEAQSSTASYVGIHFPIGELMYSVWKFVLTVYIEKALYKVQPDEVTSSGLFQVAVIHFTQEVSDALMQECLPQYFRKSAVDLSEFWTTKMGRNMDAYFYELQLRDFRGIPWNKEVLADLAGH